jgi:hypothetical protein
MRTLGLLLVAGALAYMYVQNNPAVLTSMLPAPKTPAPAPAQKEEETPPSGETGDHLFGDDLTS